MRAKPNYAIIGISRAHPRRPHNERANMTAPRKASTTAKAKADQAKAAKAEASQAKPKAELPPAPKGWATTKGDSLGTFVRYARRVRHTQIAVTAFDTEQATTTSDRRKVASWRKAGHDGRYVVVAHEVAGDAVLGSDNAWARAYAISMGMGGRTLAASVVKSITPKPKADPKASTPPKAAPKAKASTPRKSASRKAAGTKAA